MNYTHLNGNLVHMLDDSVGRKAIDIIARQRLAASESVVSDIICDSMTYNKFVHYYQVIETAAKQSVENIEQNL